jgi:hypothetical protein
VGTWIKKIHLSFEECSSNSFGLFVKNIAILVFIFSARFSYIRTHKEAKNESKIRKKKQRQTNKETVERKKQST